MTHAYSKQEVRKSFKHFLLGKIVSAFLGILMLMLLVRLLSRQEFGGYITLLAVFELLQLGSSIGSFPAAFRYVPEFRVKGQLYQLYNFISGLLLFRIITLCFAALLLFFLAPYLAQYLGMIWLTEALRLYSFVLILEGLARYIDVLFDSLLLQGYAQVSIIIRNSIRTFFLAALILGLVVNVSFNLIYWVYVEISASFIGIIIAAFLLKKTLKKTLDISAKTTSIDYSRVLQYSIPAFLAQIIGLAQGQDLIKLLIARMFDTIQVGAFGFAAAINNMMQRYLPVFLLIGMIRPIFVASKENGKENDYLITLAVLVLKLNLFFLTPIMAIVAVIGEPIMSVLSGGKFPESGLYLLFLVILLIFQTLHAVMGLLALAVEESFFGLLGTIFGLLGIVIGVIASYWIGVLALCMGLIISELLWCLTMQYALIKHNIKFRCDVKGILNFGIGACVTSGIVYVVGEFLDSNYSMFTIVALVIIGIMSFLLTIFIFKPFSDNERKMINRILPHPLFVW